MLNNAITVHKVLSCHMNMNLLACHVDITQSKENMNSLKYNAKETIFINGLKYAEKKVFCISVDLCQIYDGIEYNKLFEVLSTLKNKELKRNNILI